MKNQSMKMYPQLLYHSQRLSQNQFSEQNNGKMNVIFVILTKLNIQRRLNEAPEFSNPSSDKTKSPVSLPSTDSTRLECELDIAQEFLSHYSEPAPASSFCSVLEQTFSSAPASSFCSVPEQTFSSMPASIAKLLTACTDEVNRIMQSAHKTTCYSQK